MKLKSCSLRDFLGVSEANIDLTRPVNWVFGRNGEGKSSVAEAIRFALTGTARGTDAAGRGAAQLIRDGAKLAGVSVCFADGTAIERTIDPKGSGVSVYPWNDSSREAVKFSGKAAEQVIRERFGPPELLRCLVDAGRVLDLSGKEQSDLLSGLLGEGCTLEELGTHARAAEMPEPAIAALLEGISGRLPRGSGVVTSAILKDAHKACYDKRTEANAAKKKLEGAPVAAPLVNAPVPEAAEIESMRQIIGQLEATDRTLRADIAVLGERVKARASIEQEQARAVADLAALPQAEAPVQTELTMGPSLTQLELAVGAAKQAEADARAAYVDAGVLTSKRAAGEATLRARSNGASLACDGTIGKGKACPLAPAATTVKPADLSIAQKLLGDAQAAEGKAKTALEAAVKAHVAAGDAFVAAKLAASKSAGAGEAKREALEARIIDLAGKLETAGDPAAERATKDAQLLETGRTLDEARRTLTAKEYVTTQRGAWETYAAQLQEAKDEAELFDALVKALDPRGLPLAILSEKVGPFLSRVNAVLIQLAPYSIDIDTSDGLQLTVTPSEGGKPRSPALLSESERLRVGAALSLSLAITSGLGFAVIDRLDALLPDVRNQLVDAVEGLRSEMEGVVLLCSASAPPFEGDAETGVYWVEGGQVNSVEMVTA